MKSMLQSSLMKYSISFAKRFFSLLTWQKKYTQFLNTNAWLYDISPHSVWVGGWCLMQAAWVNNGSMRQPNVKWQQRRKFKARLFHLFKVVKSRKNDVVPSSDETHCRQQLQNQGFGSVESNGKIRYTRRWADNTGVSILWCAHLGFLL